MGSISTATDEDVDAGNDEGSCTYIGRRRSGRGASNLRLFWLPAGLRQRRIQSGWKHHLDHCSAIETLLIWSCYDCKVTLTLVNFNTNQMREKERERERPPVRSVAERRSGGAFLLLFLRGGSWCACVLRCSIARTCKHVFVCIRESAWWGLFFDAAWTHFVWLLSYPSVAARPRRVPECQSPPCLFCSFGTGTRTAAILR